MPHIWNSYGRREGLESSNHVTLSDMVSDALVSVVIPTYNRAHLVAQTLESVFAQTWPRLQVIVIDDGSKDDTEGAVAPFRDRIRYVKQENAGLAEARNHGMRLASGDFIAWLDSDDLWVPEKIALQMAALQLHPDNVLSATDFSAFDDQGFFDPSHLRSYYHAVDRGGGLGRLFPERRELDGVPVYSGH